MPSALGVDSCAAEDHRPRPGEGVIQAEKSTDRICWQDGKAVPLYRSSVHIFNLRLVVSRQHANKAQLQVESLLACDGHREEQQQEIHFLAYRYHVGM